MVEQRVQRRLVAILAGNVAGYSRLMGAGSASVISAAPTSGIFSRAPCASWMREWSMPQDDENLDDILLGPEDGNVFRHTKAGPKLRLVTDADKPLRGRSKGQKDTRPRRSKNWRLPSSDQPWVRIWLSELEDDLFKPGARLLLVLRRHAFEDRGEVELTEKIALEANIPPPSCRRAVPRKVGRRGRRSAP